MNSFNKIIKLAEKFENKLSKISQTIEKVEAQSLDKAANAALKKIYALLMKLFPVRSSNAQISYTIDAKIQSLSPLNISFEYFGELSGGSDEDKQKAEFAVKKIEQEFVKSVQSLSKSIEKENKFPMSYSIRLFYDIGSGQLKYQY